MGTIDRNAAKAAALDHIVQLIAEYLPPDSDLTDTETLGRIIETIEVRGLFQFLDIEVEPKK